MDPILSQIDFTPLAVNFAVTVAGIVLAFLGKAVRDFTVANKDNKNYGLLVSIVENAVQAVEQVYTDVDGDTKKKAAFALVEAALKARGINVDLDEIDAAIEAAVLREFNFPAAVEPAEPPTETVVTVSPSDANAGEDVV